MKIAIAGYGIEGESSYRYYSQDSDNKITIVNEINPEIPIPNGVQTLIGRDVFSKLYGYDLIIRTPGLPPNKIKADGKIWSGTNEFFAKCPAKIIGVTGSKGKGTTASLVANILESAGKKVWLVGNIGKPALDVLQYIKADDYVVYELSSFQLWDLEKSPQIAVVLFIEQEHLNVHTNMEDYIMAKSHIAIHQTTYDLIVFNKSNQYSNQIASMSKANLVGFQDQKTAHVKEGYFWYNEQKICSINTLNIVGNHNLDNACAAINAIWSITDDISAIEKGLGNFKGLPHRLQFVREIDGVKYYDDSIATTPSSAIAALCSFDCHKVIILGGSSKGSDFSELANEIKKHDAVAILIGDEAEIIADAFKKVDFKNYEIIDKPNMGQIVDRAKILADNRGVVLLSPSSASFGLFKNYIDRGEQFCASVRAL